MSIVEGIDYQNVCRWIVEHIPAVKPPLVFSLIAGGHSNLTYRFVDSQDKAYVLRRPPLGHVLQSAHDMGREYRIISALENTRVPVPKTYGLCEDPNVNGSSFYVMDFIEGNVPHNPSVMGELPYPDRRSFGNDVIEVLAHLHLTNPEDVGLGNLGRKQGYIERQLKRWTQQWEATKTHEIPDMDETLRLLHEQHPEQIGSSIVHGDYRPGNMIIRTGSMAALLDWELCTLGDPLADVGYLLNNWGESTDTPSNGSPTSVGGFPTRAEICSRYEKLTGRSLSQINYYRAFSHWRLAAIAQGVYKRYLVGAMGEQEFDLEKYQLSIVAKAKMARLMLES
ncbi:MAG: phosphotransferase family protein [Gammaproteobacteria bacterium]|nr:phosphotransferase family protein [Gammaproteobacteria bacterium]